MNDRINAILIHESDDVATGIVDFHKGDTGRYRKRDELIEIVLTDEVPKFHKFAVRDIHKGELVLKYGEVIGEATREIGKGHHVHDHNIDSPRPDK